MQRYVSDELTHFVGRSLKSESNGEENQYELLRQILSSGTLKPRSQVQSEAGRATLTPGPGTLSQNTAYRQSMVCFCDIPEVDLSLHMTKYSRFGLAFSKEFLTSRGASPVFYVAQNARYFGPKFEESSDQFTKAFWFDTALQKYRRLTDLVTHERGKRGGRPLVTKEFQHLLDWLFLFFDFNYFTFIKFFDEHLDFDHGENFYMEREWRVQTQVSFDLSNVRRIILPELYAAALRRDIPDYIGKISFAS